jgi:hypothetical protein
LDHPAQADPMGPQGHEHVLQHFVITRDLRDHLLLYRTRRLIPRKLVQL